MQHDLWEKFFVGGQFLFCDFPNNVKLNFFFDLQKDRIPEMKSNKNCQTLQKQIREVGFFIHLPLSIIFVVHEIKKVQNLYLYKSCHGVYIHDSNCKN